MIPCPQCGTTPPKGALFCPSCGTRMPTQSELIAEDDQWDAFRPAIPDYLFRPASDNAKESEDTQQFPPVIQTDPDATPIRPIPLVVVSPPAPAPATTPRQGTPEADLLPQERALIAAQPLQTLPAKRSATGARGPVVALICLMAIALVCGTAWVLGIGKSKPVTLASARSETTSSQATNTATSSTSAASVGATTTPLAMPSEAFPPAGSFPCTGSPTVAVNLTASCEFAVNVAAAIPSGAEGNFTVTATSPKTQKDYQMSCIKGTYTVCSGGLDAVVYVK